MNWITDPSLVFQNLLFTIRYLDGQAETNHESLPFAAKARRDMAWEAKEFRDSSFSPS